MSGLRQFVVCCDTSGLEIFSHEQSSTGMTKTLSFRLRAMVPQEYDLVASLIEVSTNAWYVSNGKPAIFTGGLAATRLFPEVYEALDPGCCVVAEHLVSGQIMGSCFYHPRSTHIALGIMNVHPDHFGAGLARELLKYITEMADNAGKPVRLVSSAQNLDSFSLYTRAGFVPRCTYQDMYLAVPELGLTAIAPSRSHLVRNAELADVSAMVALEKSISGIEREKDFRYFITNTTGIWGMSVLAGADGRIDGFLGSVCHPGSTMLGPGIARDETTAAALIWHGLHRLRGHKPVWLVPCHYGDLIQTLYRWGARNCELHLAQVRGPAQAFAGVTMPTFMPETG